MSQPQTLRCRLADRAAPGLTSVPAPPARAPGAIGRPSLPAPQETQPPNATRGVESGEPARRDGLDRAFGAAVVLKGLLGAVELVGGLLLLAAPQILALAVTQLELAQDPSGFFATRLLPLAHSGDLAPAGIRFAAGYLILHGVLKLALVAGLLRGKAWAYPWMIGALLVFASYQTVMLIHHRTWGLIALTGLDLVLAWLTRREWRRHQAAATGPGRP